MPRFFSNKKLIILMVSIIFLVAFIGFSLRERESVTWPEEFARDSTGFLQSLFSRPAYVVTDVINNINDLIHVYEENKQLKSRLDEHAALSAELETVKEENETLKEMLDAEDSLTDYMMRSALVIHRSPDRWTEIVGINRGEQHGIERNMAVVTSNGSLIGKVKNVSAFTSTIQLLSDKSRTNRVSAMVHTDEEPVYAFIEGWDEEREGLMLRKIESDAEIEPGQEVSTSGLGGIFPRGLVIGEVSEIEPDEYGLTYNALIEPAADFYNIDQVNVIERITANLDESLIDERVEEEEEEEVIDEELGEEGETS